MTEEFPRMSFPNESSEYRKARNALLDAEIALRRQTEEVATSWRAPGAGYWGLSARNPSTKPTLSLPLQLPDSGHSFIKPAHYVSSDVVIQLWFELCGSNGDRAARAALSGCRLISERPALVANREMLSFGFASLTWRGAMQAQRCLASTDDCKLSVRPSSFSRHDQRAARS